MSARKASPLDLRAAAAKRSLLCDGKAAPKRQRRNFGLCSGGLDDDEEEEEEHDSYPRNGRFSDAVEDADDLDCVLRPVEELTQEQREERKEQALHRVSLRDRSGKMREQQMREEQEEEEKQGSAPKLNDDAECEAILDHVRGLVVDERKQTKASLSIHTRSGLAEDLLRDQRNSPGDRILDDIRKCLNGFGYTRSTFQQARTDIQTRPHFYVFIIYYGSIDSRFRLRPRCERDTFALMRARSAAQSNEAVT